MYYVLGSLIFGEKFALTRCNMENSIRN